MDDIVIAVATLITFGHTGADYASLVNGLGTPLVHIINTGQLESLNAVSSVLQKLSRLLGVSVRRSIPAHASTVC